MGDLKYLESLPSDKCPDHARLAMVTTKELKTSIRSEKIKLMEQVVIFYSFSGCLLLFDKNCHFQQQ